MGKSSDWLLLALFCYFFWKTTEKYPEVCALKNVKEMHEKKRDQIKKNFHNSHLIR